MEICKSLLDDFRKDMIKKGKSNDTCEAYRRDVYIFAKYCQKYKLDLNQLEPSTLGHFQDHLAENAAHSNSIRRCVIAIRQFFRFLESSKILQSPFEAAIIPPRFDNPPLDLTQLDMAKILSNTHKSPNCLKRNRDCAILQLLAYEGIKASELIQLNWSDYLDHRGFGSIRLTGTRARLIHVSANTNKALKTYRQAFVKVLGNKTSVRGLDQQAGSMFIAFRGRDLNTILPAITRHGLKFMLYEVGEKAELGRINAELLRHHAIAHLIQSGRTPVEVMDHLGLKRMGKISRHLTEAQRQNLTTYSPLPASNLQ